MTSILRASQIMLSEVNQVLRPLKLNYPRFELLMLLSFSQRGRLPLGKIGERLQVHPTSVTNTVDRLEADGLVVRVPHDEDRRTIFAEITDAGRELAEDATDALRQADLSVRVLTEEEIELLTDLIRKVRLRAGDFAPPADDPEADEPGTAVAAPGSP